MYRVCCLNNIAPAGIERLGSDVELVDDAMKADALMVRSADLHSRELPEGLLAVARAGAGVNNIPVDEMTKRGVVVFNTPGANANAVKELTLLGMLLASRDVVGGLSWVRGHAGEKDVASLAEGEKRRFAGHELAGRTVGVVGLGAIGAAVANALVALGCRVLGFDPYLSLDAAWGLDRRISHVTDLGALAAASDFVTLHVPLSDATRGLVSAEVLPAMRSGSALINFARDGLVDEAALACALREGRLGRYVTDFPTPATTLMERAIVIPHLGASTAEAEENCAVMAADELREYLARGNIANSVNFPRVNMGPVGAAQRLALFHDNVQGVIGGVSARLAEAGINIEAMSNVSSGRSAYTLLDLGSACSDELLDGIRAVPGVRRLRTVGA